MFALHLQFLAKARHYVLIGGHIFLVIIGKHEVGIELGKALPNPPHEFALDDAVGDPQLIEVLRSDGE